MAGLLAHSKAEQFLVRKKAAISLTQQATCLISPSEIFTNL